MRYIRTTDGRIIDTTKGGIAMKCDDCVKQFYCKYRPYINSAGGCIEFQSKDDISYISNTITEENENNKELERLNNKNLPCSNCKALKALKIIKEKEVDVGLLIRCLNAYCIDSARQEYNQWTQTKHLTHEECVLLKEVLL